MEKDGHREDLVEEDQVSPALQDLDLHVKKSVETTYIKGDS
jgi:hypothetical protein